jgi:hypothetical protein
MQWGLDKKENWRGWSWICRNDSDRLPQHGRGGRLESVGWDLSLDVSGPNCLGSGDWDSVPWQSGLSHEDWRRRETETEAESIGTPAQACRILSRLVGLTSVVT